MTQAITVYLDDNKLEFMDDAIRCCHIVTCDDEGKEMIVHDALDSSGFQTISQLTSEIAGIFGISRECIYVAA